MYIMYILETSAIYPNYKSGGCRVRGKTASLLRLNQTEKENQYQTESIIIIVIIIIFNRTRSTNNKLQSSE